MKGKSCAGFYEHDLHLPELRATTRQQEDRPISPGNVKRPGGTLSGKTTDVQSESLLGKSKR